MFSEQQKDLLHELGIDYQSVESILFNIKHGRVNISEINDMQLISCIEICNSLYRAGISFLSDSLYDHVLLEQLKLRYPDHNFLHAVEAEPILSADTKVLLPKPMLSLEKVYSLEDLEKFLIRVEKSALQIGINKVVFRLTPKLDGFAAYDDGDSLYSRGDGKYGIDISHAILRGVKFEQRGLGAGEIVISKSYFNKYLSGYYSNTRNVHTSLLRSKILEAHMQDALDAGACVFLPFISLPDWQGSSRDLLENFDTLQSKILTNIDYDVDGLVISVIDKDLVAELGSTLHHPRSSIAYKKNEVGIETRIIDIIPQTSRTGKVNPVVQIEPIILSGANVSKVTAYNYGYVKKNGLGVGARVRVIRSGQVIPKIVEVIDRVESSIPVLCSSCSGNLEWDSDFLLCVNSNCSAQLQTRLVHFFHTLGMIDGFGPQTIAKLATAGEDSIIKIYSISVQKMQDIGFGLTTAENLFNAMQNSLQSEIEDWRFLAALGIYRLGIGASQRLLQCYSLDEVFCLTQTQIEKIDGFGPKLAKLVYNYLQESKQEVISLINLGFNLKSSKDEAKKIDNINFKLNDFCIVFTGSSDNFSRVDLQNIARNNGAKVLSQISKKCTHLVYSKNASKAKLNKAENLGINLISLDNFLDIIK